MRFTIGSKVVGITVFLLVLMGAVCGVSTWFIAKEQDRLLLVADKFQPLIDAVVDYRRAALRRQMRLAKLLRLLDAANRDAAAISEQRTLFDAEAKEAREHLDDALVRVAELKTHTLQPRERNVVRMRYGLHRPDGQSMSLHDISAAYGLSKERIRQIEEAALGKLRLPWRRTLLRAEALLDGLPEPAGELELAEPVGAAST